MTRAGAGHETRPGERAGAASRATRARMAACDLASAPAGRAACVRGPKRVALLGQPGWRDPRPEWLGVSPCQAQGLKAVAVLRQGASSRHACFTAIVGAHAELDCARPGARLRFGSWGSDSGSSTGVSGSSPASPCSRFESTVAWNWMASITCVALPMRPWVPAAAHQRVLRTLDHVLAVVARLPACPHRADLVYHSSLSPRHDKQHSVLPGRSDMKR
jgi:hypothetical protein